MLLIKQETQFFAFMVNTDVAAGPGENCFTFDNLCDSIKIEMFDS